MLTAQLQFLRGSTCLLQTSQLPQQSRQHRLLAVCGAKKQLKAARKSLEKKGKEIEDITDTLRLGESTATMQSLAAVVAGLQRLGSEVEDIACLADEASDSSSSSESDSEDEESSGAAEVPVQEPAADVQLAEAEEQEGDAGALNKRHHEEGNDSEAQGASTVSLLEVEVANSSPSETRSKSSTIQHAPAIAMLERAVHATGMPVEHESLWNSIRSALGGSMEGRVDVCQGKACKKAGSAGALQALMDAAAEHPGLEVGPSKCLDKCKQGPNLRVDVPNGGKMIIASREKPVKKEKNKQLATL